MGGVPVDVRELDDEQMAVVALSENTKRKDLSPLEQYRAWARIVAEIPGMTVERLAQEVGLDRSTVSNNLRILKLPRFVLDAVDAGEIPAHSARELLVLQNDDHAHPELMEAVLKKIRNPYGRSGLPDFRVASIRDAILEVVRSWTLAQWRPLDVGAGTTVYHLNERAVISFDFETYATDRASHVHRIPSSDKADGPSRRWTCDVKAWQRLQTAATRESNKASGTTAAERTQTSGGRAPAPSRNEQFDKAFSKHPVIAQLLKAGVSPQTDEAKQVLTERTPIVPEVEGVSDRVAGQRQAYALVHNAVLEHLQAHPNLVDDVAELGEIPRRIIDAGVEKGLTHRQVLTAAVTYAKHVASDAAARKPGKPGTLTEAQKTEAGSLAKGLAVFDYNYRGFHQRIATAMPWLAAAKECVTTCTRGAQFGQQYRGEPVELFCTNEKCHKEKLTAGAKAYSEELAKRTAVLDGEDQVLAQAIAAVLPRGMATKLVAVALLNELGAALAVTPSDDYQYRVFQYEPQTLVRIRQVLKLRAGADGRNVVFSVTQAGRQLDDADQDTTAQVCGELVAYVLRYNMGRDGRGAQLTKEGAKNVAGALEGLGVKVPA